MFLHCILQFCAYSFFSLPCSQNGQKKLSLLLDPRPQNRSGGGEGGGRGRWGGSLALQCGASTPAGRRTHGGRASKHPSRFTPPGNPGQDRVSASAALLSGTLPPFLPVRARDRGSKQRLFRGWSSFHPLDTLREDFCRHERGRKRHLSLI